MNQIKYFFILIILFLNNCTKSNFNPNLEDTTTNKQTQEQYIGPSSEHYNFSQYIYDTNTNKPVAIIKGKIAQFFKKDAKIILKFVSIFYSKKYKEKDKDNEEKEEHTKITSNEAIIYERSKLYEFKGDVVVISTNGIRFETQNLFYDEANNQIYTKPTELVHIYTKDGSITKGYFLRSDIGLNKIMLNTQRTVTPDEGLKEVRK